MSFVSPLPDQSTTAPKRGAEGRSVSCDLPARIDLVPGEVDLIERWFADLLPQIFGEEYSACPTSEMIQGK